MMWEEITLNEVASLTFQDGINAAVHYYWETVRSEWYGHARIAISDGAELDLLDVVDDGQTVDEPRIHAIYGDLPNEVFLFGGPIAYRIDSTGMIREMVEL